MSWAKHGGGAVIIGFRLIGVGLACLVHAVVPGLFTDTVGKAVNRLHDQIHQRRSFPADPEGWPDDDI